MNKICLIICFFAASLAHANAHVTQATDTCKIPTVVTPNSDGKNDMLEIECLKNLGPKNDSELSIFSRWGDRIFYAKPYQNDFDGTYRGTRLPDGVYAYIFKFNGVEIKGMLTVVR